MIKMATRITAAIGFCVAASFAFAQGPAIGFSAVEGNLSVYLGQVQGHYAPNTDSLVFDQFSNAFGAMNVATKVMVDGDTLLSAQSAQSLVTSNNNPLGAAVLLGSDKQVKGAALLHFACVASKNASFKCNDAADPVLTIFITSYKKDDAVVNAFVVSKFQSWAMSTVGASIKASGHLAAASHLRIQVREVGPQST